MSVSKGKTKKLRRMRILYIVFELIKIICIYHLLQARVKVFNPLTLKLESFGRKEVLVWRKVTQELGWPNVSHPGPRILFLTTQSICGLELSWWTSTFLRFTSVVAFWRNTCCDSRWLFAYRNTSLSYVGA